MSSIIQQLMQRLGGEATSQVGQQLGTDPDTTSKAIGLALPVILGALARNSASDDGAGNLAAALGRDHDGSILNDVPGALANFQTGAGAGILRHVLGGNQETVTASVGQAAGLDVSKAGALLTMLAPLVMGALGSTRRSQNLDPAGVAALLSREKAQAAPTGLLGGLLGSLDANKDGSVMDDITGMAGKVFSRG